MPYLRSCMKWQIGQATSLYLCPDSGITGFAMVRSSQVCCQGRRITYNEAHSEPRPAHCQVKVLGTRLRKTHHLVMQCADQFPQLWHCAVTPSYPSKGLLNSVR